MKAGTVRAIVIVIDRAFSNFHAAWKEKINRISNGE